MLTDRALMESKRRRTGLQALAALIGLAVILSVIWYVWLRTPAEPTPYPHVVTYYADTFGSDRSALQEILFSSDCSQLDAWRLQAATAYDESAEDPVESSAQLGLMAAAGDRMDDLGCPK